MKKQFLFGLFICLAAMPTSPVLAQTTEGTDFWVTLMRGDERKYEELSLTFSAKEATKVYVENTYDSYYDTVSVGDNDIQRLLLNDHESSCYVHDLDEERVSNHALHVTSDKPISLIAANYKDKSFDVASILPTAALKSEYRIQCYTPYAHEDNEQGSHFAIVAAEDNVVVDYILTENSDYGKRAGDTCTTDTLQKGQVWYVWSGQNKKRDFTGSIVKARNNKKIAVFNGNSHTNIGEVRDRDHVYSQAMPINYWGKRFAITSSLTTIDGQAEGTFWERIDKIRVQALVDGTVVKIDGDSVYTFDFQTNPKHYYEFDFGAQDALTGYKGDGHSYFEGASHYIETSCPSAVHLFMTSDRYDHDKVKGVNEKYCNGDPSEIWVNPVEQKIQTLTFGTFQTKQVQDHFINIVTTADNVSSIELDGKNIASEFKSLNGNPEYVYARITAVENGTHTLTSDSGFIAHVYGFGEKESYGYPAGGNTKDLTAFITINGEEYHADSDNKICGEDKVVFSCELNYEYDSIYWNFGDGKDTMAVQIDSVEHFYDIAKTYQAYVLIYRHYGDDEGCLNLSDHDSIAFHVNIGRYQFSIGDVDVPCAEDGKPLVGKIYFDNISEVDLTGDNVTIEFDEVAQRAGFDNSQLIITDKYFQITVPQNDKVSSDSIYGIHLVITSNCGGADTTMHFGLSYDKDVITQRYNNVLGLLADSFEGATLSGFQWYRTSDSTAIDGQISSNLNFYDIPYGGDINDSYYVCFWLNEGTEDEVKKCACAKKFAANTDQQQFGEDAVSLTITASYAVKEDKIFVNADWGEKTDIECYAQWITTDGKVYGDKRFYLPDGGCTIPTPNDNGLYLLRVVTDKSTRSFKFLINK